MDEPKSPAVRMKSSFADLVSVLAIATGALVLAGWLLDAPLLERLFFDAAVVGPVGAVAFLLTGGALALINRQSRKLRLAGQFLALLTALLGVATLIQYFTGMDLGLDRFSFAAGLAPPQSASVGRLPLPLAIAYALLGISLSIKGHSRQPVADGIGFVTFLFLYFGFLYAVFKIEILPFHPVFELALPAWGMDLLLCLGVAFTRPSDWLQSVMSGNELAGEVMRRLFAIVVAAPPLLGWAWLLMIRSGLLSSLSRLMAFALGFTALLVALAALDAHRLDQIEAERRTALDALATSKADLRKAEESSRIKDHFLSTISHEMRTPLSLIMGYAEILEDKNPNNEFIAGIQDGALRLAEHIDKIVDYSALLGGSLPLYRTDLNLPEIARNTVEAERERALGQGVSLELDVQAEIPFVVGDTRRLTQILKELLDNAIKVTPRGGRAGIRIAPAGKQVRIDVWDSGSGIGDEEMERLWVAFDQLETGDATRRGGLGLGLPIVKKLVELHGGTLTVTSRPCQGSTFTVFLPARESV